jgi:hypothetical protein
LTRGPILSPVLESEGKVYLPGQQILNPVSSDPVNTDHPITELIYRIQVSHAPEGSYLIWFVDGKKTHIQSIEMNEINYAYSFAWNLKVFRWIRLEVRDAAGQLLALVNPFYCGTPIQKKRLWSEYVNWKAYTKEGAANDRTDS